MVLGLVSGEQCLAVKRFHADEYLKASRSCEQIDEILLSGNLRVALNEEGYLDFLGNHCLQQSRRLGVLVEVVCGEHDRLHSGSLCRAQTGKSDFEVLRPYGTTGDFDHRAEIAGERTPAGGIDPEHGDDVPTHVCTRRRLHYRRVELLLPALPFSVNGPQFPLQRIFQNLWPDCLRFRQGKANAAAMEHRCVARHGMRPAHDAVLHAVLQRVSRKIKASLKLMRLNTDERKQRRAVLTLQLPQVAEICLDVFVDDVRFYCTAIDLARGHAAKVGDRRVRHESASESLHTAIRVVFAWLQDQNAKLLHGSTLRPTKGDAGLQLSENMYRRATEMEPSCSHRR